MGRLSLIALATKPKNPHSLDEEAQVEWPNRVLDGDSVILAADVVGFSRLMEIDEAGTLARLKSLRREIIDPAIAAHSGRMVKLMGDGALVEFASAVDAVTCAIEIQKSVRKHNADGAAEEWIQFRIGINVGDIIVDGEDIMVTA